MSEVKIPFTVKDRYGMLSLSVADLTEEELLACQRSTIDLDELTLDIYRRLEEHDD